jgi:histone-lysine N-methyltransferase SETMAR
MTSGPLLVHQIPSGTSINATYYRDACLKSLVKKLHKKRPSSTENHVKLHHDNASPHINNIVFSYFQEEKIKLMAHPPYSPNLASSDFWLFNYLKSKLSSYPDAATLAKSLSKELNSIPIQEYQKTFKKWIERMKLCVKHRGEYFKHLL